MTPKTLQYIDFFEQFAKAHVDIAHMSAVDNPMRAANSTANTNRSHRFTAAHMERVADALSNASDAEYKAAMFLEMYDFAPYQNEQKAPLDTIVYNGAVTITQITTEDDIAQENNKKDITEGIILDLMHYLNLSGAFLNDEQCHPFLQSAHVQKMNVVPEYNILAPNDHGWTLEFSFTYFLKSYLRVGKFRPNFLPALPAPFLTESPLAINPTSLAPAEQVALTGPALQTTTEVRFCSTTSETCYRLPIGDGSSGTFQYIDPDIIATLPNTISPDVYTVEVYTDLGSWISEQLLTVTS